MLWPLLVAVPIALLGKKRRDWREAATLLIAGSLFALVASKFLPAVAGPASLHKTAFEIYSRP